jgi:hypothetical protein
LNGSLDEAKVTARKKVAAGDVDVRIRVEAKRKGRWKFNRMENVS